jgi:oligopeptide/dipeptide ABC transporter ATP-binding protein
MADPTADVLKVEDVRVRFRLRSGLGTLLDRTTPAFIEAVSGVSFSIREGETFALVGESGSGKTTLAYAITGLARAQEGRIRFEGQTLNGLSDATFKVHRRHMAMMFQDPVGSLSPRLSVRSLVTEPFKIHGLTKRDLSAEARRLLALVGLPAEFASRYPHELSGGQARRVGVARALALSPKLIVADEPTAGLDVSVQGEVLNLLGRLQRELGISILIITHNLAVVRHVADRMAIMYLGRFVEEGPTEAIFAHPRHPYTLALLSANPEPDPDAVLDALELEGEVPSLLERPGGCEFHPRCPFAQARCRAEAPQPVAAGQGHSLTCHFPLAERPGIGGGR